MLCSKIGDCPKDQLESAGIRVSDEWAYEYIESAISAHYAREYGDGAAGAPGLRRITGRDNGKQKESGHGL